jgi:CDP-diacylglycerol--glycerol-3-phosphate 3-phosphatidyltransferase
MHLMNLPNILTLARVFAIPLMLLAFYWPWAGYDAETMRLVAAWCFIIASITDWFDGWLARKWNQSTPFGAFLDPVADKLIVACALVALVHKLPLDLRDGLFQKNDMHETLIVLSAAIIICREILVSALREWMAGLGLRSVVAVGWIGKCKTTAQMLAIGFMLWKVDSLAPLPTYAVGVGFLYIAAVLTLWSMLIYLQAAWPALIGKK